MTKPQDTPPTLPLFDHALLHRRHRRAVNSGRYVQFLQREAASEIADRLTMVKRSFESALELFPQGDLLIRAIARTGKVENIASHRFGAGDGEILPLAPRGLDLIASAMALQWANDLPGLLVQINRCLKPGGLFLGSMLGGQTLSELRRSFAAAEEAVEGGISPRVSPFADTRQMGALLQRTGFAIPVADRDILKVNYRHPRALMADLRAMGATNVLSARRKTPLRRKTLQYMTDYYIENFSTRNGRITASFEIIYLSGWREGS